MNRKDYIVSLICFLTFSLFLIISCRGYSGTLKDEKESKRIEIGVDNSKVIADTINRAQRNQIDDAITGKVVVIYIPTDEQIENQKERIGEDNFRRVVDDNTYYNSLAIKFLDSLKIEVVFSDKEIFKFKTLNGTNYNINRHNLTDKEWGALYFNSIDEPMPIIITKINEYSF